LWDLARRGYYFFERLLGFPHSFTALIAVLRSAQNLGRLQRFARENRIPLFRWDEIPWRFPDSRETLFIIGTGPSRSQSLAQFSSELRKADSIAINDELETGFIPTVSLREEGPLPGKWSQSPNEFADITAYSIPVNLWDQAATHDYLQRIATTPRACIYATINPMTLTSEKAVQLFNPDNWGHSRIAGFGSVIPGSQASLFRAIWIGISAGFQNIVLIGIDLASEEWCALVAGHNPLESSRTVQPPDEYLHRTLRFVGKYSIPLLEMIESLRVLFKEIRSGDIWVASTISPLLRVLPSTSPTEYTHE
jgi:hypothetical protein